MSEATFRMKARFVSAERAQAVLPQLREWINHHADQYSVGGDDWITVVGNEIWYKAVVSYWADWDRLAQILRERFGALNVVWLCDDDINAWDILSTMGKTLTDAQVAQILEVLFEYAQDLEATLAEAGIDPEDDTVPMVRSLARCREAIAILEEQENEG